MLYQSFGLLAVTLASVSAFPTAISKREDFVQNSDGNIKLTFSDQTIKLGTISVDDIFDKLTVACSPQGLCDTSPIDIKGQLIAAGRGGDVEDETLTVNPTGSYPTKMHDNLIDALKAAVKAVAKCEDVTNSQDCAYSPMSYCPGDETTVNECTVPQFWGINYQAADLGDAAPPSIEADMQIELDTDGFCSTFADIGSAVAGAVNGVAGGAFSLLGLFCQD